MNLSRSGRSDVCRIDRISRIDRMAEPPSYASSLSTPRLAALAERGSWIVNLEMKPQASLECGEVKRSLMAPPWHLQVLSSSQLNHTSPL